MKQVLSIQYLRAIAALGVVFFTRWSRAITALKSARLASPSFSSSASSMASLMPNDGAGPGSFLDWRRPADRRLALYALEQAGIAPVFGTDLAPLLTAAARVSWGA